MRALIAQEKGDSDPWDLKLARGGLLDVEFVAQYLTLRHARAHPGIRQTSTAAVLRHARDGALLEAGAADALIDAHKVLSDVTQLLRLCVEGRFDPATAPIGVKRRIATALGLPDFNALAGDLEARRAEMRACYDRVLAAP